MIIILLRKKLYFNFFFFKNVFDNFILAISKDHKILVLNIIFCELKNRSLRSLRSKTGDYENKQRMEAPCKDCA